MLIRREEQMENEMATRMIQGGEYRDNVSYVTTKKVLITQANEESNRKATRKLRSELAGYRDV